MCRRLCVWSLTRKSSRSIGRRSLDGKPALFSTNWFPNEVGAVIAGAPDVLNGTGSVNDALRQAGYVINGARRVIHAMRAPKDVARHLGIRPGGCVLRIRSLSWDEHDRRFDYYQTWVLTDTVPIRGEYRRQLSADHRRLTAEARPASALAGSGSHPRAVAARSAAPTAVTSGSEMGSARYPLTASLISSQPGERAQPPASRTVCRSTASPHTAFTDSRPGTGEGAEHGRCSGVRVVWGIERIGRQLATATPGKEEVGLKYRLGGRPRAVDQGSDPPGYSGIL